MPKTEMEQSVKKKASPHTIYPFFSLSFENTSFECVICDYSKFYAD